MSEYRETVLSSDAEPGPCNRNCSADAVRSRWADVIVANIDAATLELIAPELERVRKPESTLILSGFPEWDMPEGFSPSEVLSLEEWRCLVCVGHR